MIKFTIIIPVFNPDKSFYKCIDSILNQKLIEWEVIVIDGSFSILVEKIKAEILDSRFMFISEFDRGVYDAMNKGLALSKGQWVYFLGSDDYLYNELVLWNIWEAINKTKLPVIYGNVLIEGNTGWAKDGEVYSGFFSKGRMLSKAICHQSIFYKKQFLYDNFLYFDLRFPVSSDWHFNLKCRRISKFKYLNIIVAVFKAGGISSSQSDYLFDELKLEFSDLYPSKLEILLERLFKKFKRLLYS